tara:strand:+ start:359 stop:688 length:330 start_codon:yes stop_codon:yes gene_type:complete
MNGLSRLLCVALERHLAGKRPMIPEGGAMIWNAFAELSSSRSMGPTGPNPITPSDVLAWSQLMRVPLEPHHARALLAMDQVFLRSAVSRAAGGAPKSSLSSAAFDAAFG